ncbi:MAG: 2-amino-4-hydroxy-6-hydroxymethyldihydropteridine diphosphokinase [Rhizobiales bacterium]|nr:2-amino-4-hydroxy-6-hydroxymethyldihydropteridine diphosphokinase [Hyphomicrobiales bacterium]
MTGWRDIGFGLGANLGDKAGHVREAAARLARSGLVEGLELSSLWRTPPWGKTDQDWFVNAVAVGRSRASADELLALALSIEQAMGRVRGERWGPRGIDVDLLFVGAERVDRPGLMLPHPRIAERGFVLVPLAEVRPGIMVDGRRADDRARDFSGEAIVRL